MENSDYECHTSGEPVVQQQALLSTLPPNSVLPQPAKNHCRRVVCTTVGLYPLGLGQGYYRLPQKFLRHTLSPYPLPLSSGVKSHCGKAEGWLLVSHYFIFILIMHIYVILPLCKQSQLQSTVQLHDHNDAAVLCAM